MRVRLVQGLVTGIVMAGVAVSAMQQPRPEETEVWEPVPPVVTPGESSAAPPSDAVVLFDGTNLDEWVNTNDKGPAGWTVAATSFFVGNMTVTLEGPAADAETGEGVVYTTVTCYGADSAEALARSRAADASSGSPTTDLEGIGEEGYQIDDDTGLSRYDANADVVMGHEYCAEIVDYGPATQRQWPVGTRVSSLPVLLSEPWLKFVWMLESCTPVPTWMADWLEVEPEEGADERSVLEKLSAKVAFELL